jgi:predicted metal-dependent peptidase
MAHLTPLSDRGRAASFSQAGNVGGSFVGGVALSIAERTQSQFIPALAIDTSGSMGDAELSRAVSETIGVVKAVGAAVQLYSCDAAVHAAAPVKSLADVARNLKGGGGTLFQPVFDALEKAQPKPDVLVFVTDGGCFDAPKQPRGVKVVWVLVGKHRCRPNGVDWGDFVEVDED